MELQINDLQKALNKQSILAENLTATNRMLEADNAVAKNEIIRVETENYELQEKKKEIEYRLGIQNNRIADLEQTTSDQSRDIERKDNRITVLESKTQQQSTEIADQEETILFLQAKKTELESEISVLTEQRDKLKTKVKKLDKKLAFVRNTGGDMAKAYEALQKEYDKYQIEMKDKYDTAQLEILHHEENFQK